MKRTGLYFKVKNESQRRFFPGALTYHLALPNRVYKLIQHPAHYNRVYGSVTKAGRAVDHRHPECYAMNVRYAFFNVYAHYPETGKQKMNLLQDVIGTDDISAWERVTPIDQIVLLLMGLDL